jgi:coenzyme PQQ synthesis protein D (PqqD)
MNELRLNPNAVAWQEIDGEVLALAYASSSYLSTSGIGARLWKALAVGASRADLIEDLASSFGIGEGAAAADVDDFLRALEAEGLLAT